MYIGMYFLIAEYYSTCMHMQGLLLLEHSSKHSCVWSHAREELNFDSKTYSSITRTKLLVSSEKSLAFIRCGWSSRFSTVTSLTTSSLLFSFLSITFTAHGSLFFFSVQRKTVPNFPLRNTVTSAYCILQFRHWNSSPGQLFFYFILIADVSRDFYTFL